MVTGDDDLLPGELLRWLAEHGTGVYLVGGCLRDRLLDRPIRDLDLVVATGGLSLARRVADRFLGDYYPLDEARGTGRALLRTAQGDRLVVDVSEFRGPDLPSDLADRDFTINALAEDLAAPGRIIDRFHSIDDLRAGIIRPVGPDSIRKDPVRALRAVRLSDELGFVLAPETEELIRLDGAALVAISGERIRDELARILSSPHAAQSLSRLDVLGLLTVIFPELEPLRGMEQPAPHYLDGLRHSLETVRALDRLVAPLAPNRLDAWAPGEGEEVASWPEAVAPLIPRLRLYLVETLGDLRPRLVSLKLAALLHDTGKPSAKEVDAEGRLRFVGHERTSAALAGDALRRLHFTNLEVRLVETIVRHHMRPLLLAAETGGHHDGHVHEPREVSARAIYRFFRDTGDAGLGVLLHAMADHLAIYRPGSAPEAWQRLLDLSARMLSDYYVQYSDEVAPDPLLDGHDLMRELVLSPGRQIGELLEAVREAQFGGEVASREEALVLVRRLVGQAGRSGAED